MLLLEKLKILNFSQAEKQAANALQNCLDRLESLSITDLAERSDVSPAAVVRLAKKLGFKGWREFKEALMKEVGYLSTGFNDLDANYPFGEEDSLEKAAYSLARLYQESIMDTMHLLDLDTLKQAVHQIVQSPRLICFAAADMNFVVSKFAFQLDRIGFPVHHPLLTDTTYHTALQMSPDQTALVVSYSGETPSLKNVMRYLKENQIPTIVLTSLGKNTLSEQGDIVLHCATRETFTDKIYGFSSMISISLVLDILYSAIYLEHYRKYKDFKISKAKRIETDKKGNYFDWKEEDINED